jgi:hypothetical protein
MLWLWILLSMLVGLVLGVLLVVWFLKRAFAEAVGLGMGW